MLNFMVANFVSNKNFDSKKRLLQILRAQIDNSLDLKWSIDDIVVMSNFEFEYRGIKTTVSKLNETCATGSKMFGLRAFLSMVDYEGTIWSHDLDVWENVKIDEPKLKDIGIAQYSNGKYNGGSLFWKVPESNDIIAKICSDIEAGNLDREEPTLNTVLKSKEFKSRVAVVNNTYNVGCSGYVVRFTKSEKPLRVIHHHPDNRIAWETHALDRNNLGEVGITIRLERIIRSHYPNLAYKVTSKKMR